MGLMIVAGGNYGSEGKGKVAAYLAKKNNATAAVKVGGTNSGHTVYKDGKPVKLRMLPTASIVTDCDIIFPAGSYIDIDILMKEMKENNIEDGRVFVDKNAITIGVVDSLVENGSGLGERIGSTLSGTGAGVSARISRGDGVTFAAHSKILKKYLSDTKARMRDFIDADKCIVVEGTQGYELSVLHTRFYPYCTSRDTSIEGILSEVGMSVRDVDKTCMVFRTFPIRVGGNSGPLPFECSWLDVSEYAGTDESLEEYTTVTNKLRRVASFDLAAAVRVMSYERPDIVVMNHMDYIDYGQHGKDSLSYKQQVFAEVFKTAINHEIDIFGNGPDNLFTVG